MGKVTHEEAVVEITPALQTHALATAGGCCVLVGCVGTETERAGFVRDHAQSFCLIPTNIVGEAACEGSIGGLWNMM